MSIAMLVDNPAGSRELYERILDNLGHDVPLGGVLHLAGPGPEGGWRVIEIWGSTKEARALPHGAIRSSPAGGRLRRPSSAGAVLANPRARGKPVRGRTIARLSKDGRARCRRRTRLSLSDS